MPELDGIDALKIIKSIDANAQVIMCSSMGLQRIVIETFEAGAKDFVVKPFLSGRIQQAVENISRDSGKSPEKKWPIHLSLEEDGA